MPELAVRDKRLRWYARGILLVACLWFARNYTTTQKPYIDLARYARGQERMPFQGRDLMRWPMLLAANSAWLRHAIAGRALVKSPEWLVMEIAALVGLLLAAWAAVKLYRLAAPGGPLPELAVAILIVICLFDFSCDNSYSFPYDLPAVAFLGWGTYFVMRRWFAALVPLFVFATWNRETAVFLVGVLLLVAASREGRVRWQNLRGRDWMQAAVLMVIWAAITGLQKHHYAGLPTEAGLRVKDNLHFLAKPILWPNILCASAFLLPFVYLGRHRIRYEPIRASLLILPFWVLLLLSVGQILEIRIYGDISVLIAVAAALIVVDLVRSPGKAGAVVPELAEVRR